MRQILLRWLIIFACASAFGVVDAIVKGHHGGVRNAIGDVSAPWAVIPLLAGAVAVPRRLFLGALAGALTSLTTLLCYSLVRPDAVALGGRGGFGAVVTNRWLIAGLLGGLALGSVGAFLADRRSRGPLIAIVASLFVLEPAVRVLWAIAKHDPFGTMVPNPAVWSVEALCGLLLALGGRRLRREHQDGRATFG